MSDLLKRVTIVENTDTNRGDRHFALKVTDPNGKMLCAVTPCRSYDTIYDEGLIFRRPEYVVYIEEYLNRRLVRTEQVYPEKMLRTIASSN